MVVIVDGVQSSEASKSDLNFAASKSFHMRRLVVVYDSCSRFISSDHETSWWSEKPTSSMSTGRESMLFPVIMTSSVPPFWWALTCTCWSRPNDDRRSMNSIIEGSSGRTTYISRSPVMIRGVVYDDNHARNVANSAKYWADVGWYPGRYTAAMTCDGPVDDEMRATNSSNVMILLMLVAESFKLGCRRCV